ncbi:MAG: HD domain-containing protein [Treponema sp.]|nr:HD domain-containing protein [Treponema sp.]
MNFQTFFQNSYLYLLWFSVGIQLVAIVVFNSTRATEAKKYVISALNGTLIYSIATLIHFLGSTEQALSIGVKVQHAVALMLSVTLFVTFCYVYNESISKGTSIFLGIVLVIMFLPVFGATKDGKGPFAWFFQKFEVVNVDGLSFVDIGFSPYRIFYLGLIGLFLFHQLVIFIKSFVIAHRYRYRIQHHFFYVAYIPQVLIMLDLIFDMYRQRIPLVPIACIIGTGATIFFIGKKKVSNLYDISRSEVINSLGNPLFIIDNRFFVRYANKAAKVLFPEYKSLKEDSYKRLKACIELQNLITPPIHETLTIDDGILKLGKLRFEFDVHRMGSERSLQGYVITLYDVTDQIAQTDFLEQQNIALSSTLRAMRNRSMGMRDKLVSGALQFVQEKHSPTADHMRRTSNYTFVIARELRRLGYYTDILTDSYMETLGQIAPIHDIGKIMVPTEILSKSNRTEEEQKVLNSHTVMGMQIVDRMIVNNPDDLFYRLAHEVTLYHHEWWNGNGSPNGLVENEIPLSARIIAVADVFDSLSARHAARGVYQFEKACEIVEDCSGKRFDPCVVDAFKSARQKLKELYDQMSLNVGNDGPDL